ncbi:hypothetical protein [Sphingobacterium sp. LRF_L2]|uniref:hypothetical protein n=1 Tax=Sphingobacterium sp. LRF_L2 TaxID=3369421 RepID=UPI003F605376
MKLTDLRRTMLAIAVMFLFWQYAQAQHTANASSFEGVWAGQLQDENEEVQYLIIRIINGDASKYSYNEENNSFEANTFDLEKTMITGNNASYTWMNKGGVWTETQTHLLSYLKPGELWCRMIRQVTNAKEDEDNPGINNEWSTYYYGRLSYHRSIEAFVASLEE